MVTEGDLIKVCRFQGYRLCIIKVYTETYIFSLTNITPIRSIKRNKNKESQAAGSCEVSPRARRGEREGGRGGQPLGPVGAGGGGGEDRRRRWMSRGLAGCRPRESSYFERLFLHGSAQRTPSPRASRAAGGSRAGEGGGPFWRGRGLAQPPPDTQAPPSGPTCPPPSPARPAGTGGRRPGSQGAPRRTRPHSRPRSARAAVTFPLLGA